MKTKYFADKDKLYFTSDQHFMHKGVIGFCDRPYKDVVEMGEDFIRRWNDKVPEDGIVFILGDFCWAGKKHWVYYLDKLNGMKILIPGNHDKSIPTFAPGFGVWGDLAQIKVKDGDDMRYMVMCHYPMLSWYRSHHDSWQLFGHMHGDHNQAEFNVSDLYRETQIDVGVDSHDYEPISYEEVKCLINSRS